MQEDTNLAWAGVAFSPPDRKMAAGMITRTGRLVMRGANGKRSGGQQAWQRPERAPEKAIFEPAAELPFDEISLAKPLSHQTKVLPGPDLGPEIWIFGPMPMDLSRPLRQTYVTEWRREAMSVDSFSQGACGGKR
ncbi:hypothetical protein [Neorhizobium petrolearium]|uniref:hypothetical protein n=1 Tax=Neorhizobium petrolearium TaxID=515361 RepID=UPI003F7FEF10